MADSKYVLQKEIGAFHFLFSVNIDFLHKD